MFEKAYLKLNKYRFFRSLFSFIEKMGEKNLSSYAAGIAFYFFISIIPMFVLLSSQLPYTGISQDTLTHAINEITPNSINGVITTVVAQAYSMRSSVFSVSAIFLIWSSSKLMLSIIHSLEDVYCQKQSRNFFAVIFYAILYTILLLLLVGGAVVLASKKAGIARILHITLPTNEILVELNNRISTVAGYGILALVLALIYTVVPYGRRNYLFQVPGAVLASALIAGFSFVFSFYSQKNNIYSTFYGSLAGIALFMVWAYSCINMFLIGALFNAEYSEKLKRKLDIRKKQRKNRNGTD